MLELQSVTKRFGGLTAVDGVSFGVGEREIVGLIGPNGAGKTTLFNLVSGVYRPDHGQILFAGQDVSRVESAQVARLGLARTFQIVQPFGNMTVLENVMVGAFAQGNAVRSARARAEETLSLVNLEHRATRLAAALTTAEKKRLELARALATGPKLLLLDEVMAGLNATEVHGVLDFIRSLREKGLTVLMIEHNMQAVMTISDRVAVLNYGRLIAFGSPKAVVHDEEVIRAYLGEDITVAES